jgi:membrane protein
VYILFRDTFQQWNSDKASTWAAALAYYTIFSIGPLLLIAISIAGLVFGEQAAQGQITGRVEGIVGRDAAQVVQGLLQAANKRQEGIIGTTIGIVTLLLGASGFFGQLQTALNEMWKVEPPKRSVFQTIVSRGLTFVMVLGAGILVIALLAVSAAISAITAFFGQLLPGPLAGILLGVVDFVVSFGVITAIFAAIYRVLPDTTVDWRDVWLGAAFTALLFVIGKVALGIYLGRASVGSAFGAAGSLVVLLVWIYYSAQIFLFGAEFTQVFSNKYGPKQVPAEHPKQPEAARDIAEQEGPPEARGKAQERPAGGGPHDMMGDQPQPRQGRPSPLKAGLLQVGLVLGAVAAGFGALRGGRG